MTSARWFARDSDTDLYTNVYWEHPNFADEVESALTSAAHEVLVSGSPFPPGCRHEFNPIIRLAFNK